MVSEQAWHAQSVPDALEALETHPNGLSDAEAAARLERYGPNRLHAARPVSAFRILRDQLTSVVVFLLAAAGLVSAAMGDWAEAAAVGVVLLINTVLGFVTEFRARRAMEALLKLDVPRASVVRGGRVVAIDAADLVPGDVIQLDEGQHVPADARLVEGTDLRTNEAALTGESLPVTKQPDVVLPADAPLADRANMVFKSTVVAAGTARAVVVATGAATEIGKIGTLVGEIAEEKTPLERRLDALGRRLVWVALAVAGLVILLGVVQGAALDIVVKTGIALAVAAVPEALPAVATIALAVGLHRMARRRALVRRLPAVEALGATTVVCTDKTLTLTSGKMVVAKLWTAGTTLDVGEEKQEGTPPVRRALEAAALASRAPAPPVEGEEKPVGDPVDVAILEAAARFGIDRNQLAEKQREETLIPFSSERKFTATLRPADRQFIAYVKGAPGKVLEMSGRVLNQEGEQPLDEGGRKAVMGANEALAAAGLRVLATADGKLPKPEETELHDLTFLGLIGIIDPPAPGVKDTIGKLREAGLRTIMLTGDQRLTAEAIGRELGIVGEGDRVIDGKELDALSEEDLERQLDHIAAFSRVTPQHKLTIVKALQARGEIVAMLGDGVNDAAALKKADVGVAMGNRGTDVAKEAAAIVLQDDRFETIAAAVEEGRVIYENIRKFVFYLFSCNLAEVLVLLAAGILGLPLPLLPLQILWLNMVTDTFPALALAMEPSEGDVMRRPPKRPDEAIMSRPFVSQIALYGMLITVATLAAYMWALTNAREQANTISFMTLSLAQIFHLANARSEGPVLSPRRIASNPYALAAVALSILLQLAAIYLAPLPRILNLAPLERSAWTIVLIAALVPAVVGQAVKLLARARTPTTA